MLDFLQFFGITPDKYPFLTLGIIIVAGFIYIRLSIGKKLGKVKDNMLIIITHLSSRASYRARLDTSLIQIMSPMTITEQGHQVLQESGFEDIASMSTHRAEILQFLSEQSPKTKLDVENFAIILFATILEKDFMNPVKTYLYNKPNMRDVYMTLAGLYIRDEYLKEHPEIVQ